MLAELRSATPPARSRQSTRRSVGSGLSPTSPRSSVTWPRVPGWLEWTWAGAPARLREWTCCRPRPGAPRRASASRSCRTFPRHALRVWGVTAEGEAAIRATCTSFVRVSPANLMLSGLLRRLLKGDRPAGAPSLASDWTPRLVARTPPAARRSRHASADGAGGARHARHEEWETSRSCRGSTGCSRPGPASSPTWPRCSVRISTTPSPARRAGGSSSQWTPRFPPSSPCFRLRPPRLPCRPPGSSPTSWPRSTATVRRALRWSSSAG
jgi:hypothetical protein